MTKTFLERKMHTTAVLIVFAFLFVIHTTYAEQSLNRDVVSVSQLKLERDLKHGFSEYLLDLGHRGWIFALPFYDPNTQTIVNTSPPLRELHLNMPKIISEWRINNPHQNITIVDIGAGDYANDSDNPSSDALLFGQMFRN